MMPETQQQLAWFPRITISLADRHNTKLYAKLRSKKVPSKVAQHTRCSFHHLTLQIQKFTELSQTQHQDYASITPHLLRGILEGLGYMIEGSSQTINYDLKILERMAMTMKELEETSVKPYKDAHMVLQDIAFNKMAKQLAGPVFIDYLKRRYQFTAGGREQVVSIHPRYMKEMKLMLLEGSREERT